MKRYAFIDVQNTETTALKILGIIIDWQKLIHYLETKWNCHKIFLYPGIEIGDEDRKEMFSNLQGKTAQVIVTSKEYNKYKNKDKIIPNTCPNCNHNFVTKISMGYSWKCNCDVELAIDVLKSLDQGISEIILFSGDGDFVYMIEEAILKGISVRVFSSAMPEIGTKHKRRLATRLKKLTDESGKPVTLLELNNIKYIIQKEIEG